MTTSADPRQLQQRLHSLEGHLKEENPVLLQVVQSFRNLDRVAYRLGLMDRTESYATRVPWWPLVSVLGTYSSGKSTFINHYLGSDLQSTGNQAVDDKFTVICYAADETPRTLPGLSLDADPRFPFYQISSDIEAVASGEGRRVDAYLQLKTCHSEQLRGKIMIDSPGFDADAQRTSTLRITDHIVDLSDLVLVFFDARHPEPGAMQDSLQHLVGDTINRPDSNKFLYILNQIDTTAREDNPEEVFAAWQRALAQKGLTAGRFFRIYNPDAAVPIDDPGRRARFESKRDMDLAEIHDRMQQVEVERAYRIIGVLEKTAKTIEERLVPLLHDARQSWRRRVLWTDAIIFSVIAAIVLGLTVKAGYWQGLRFNPPWLSQASDKPMWLAITAVVLIVAGFFLHLQVRKWLARSMEGALAKAVEQKVLGQGLVKAFRKNTGPFRSLFRKVPVGWNRGSRKRIAQVIADADRYVQALNDQFTNPSGEHAKPATETSPESTREAAMTNPAEPETAETKASANP